MSSVKTFSKTVTEASIHIDDQGVLNISPPCHACGWASIDELYDFVDKARSSFRVKSVRIHVTTLGKTKTVVRFENREEASKVSWEDLDTQGGCSICPLINGLGLEWCIH